ncbi:MAG: hypothetical protein F4Z29_14955 [Gemmatimonadetes bacterium]|nr:BatD family protein [Gemmatimonadota bacterium]MXY98984.1 hypothetical protein [Gemmatimonadota bacterium]MYE93543.1 hypothetical protein [Gemmatimonadota bacterium]MYJ10933.1 hypothetical protein [Gemmatimonadota bacterium]
MTGGSRFATGARWSGFLGLWMTALGLPVAALAQDVGARAFLSAPQVGVGRQFVLNVEVSGTQQLDADPVLPDMEDFASFLSAGTSTSIQIVNGRTSMAITYQYRFQALTEGTFEIGPVSVTVGDEVVQTEPVTLVVSDAPPPPAAGVDPADPGAAIGPDDLFLETRVSSNRVFENEPIIVEYRIFTRVPVQSYAITTLPQATGFWTEELEQPAAPQAERVVRNGSEYLTATVRRVVLFPTGPGSKTLDPLSVEAQVRVRERSVFDPFSDIFGRSSLFDQRVPVVVASRPVTLEVLPLPSADRPRSFAGHVGTLGVSASVDRAAVETNEAVTLTVEYSGTGNLRTLAPPEIDFPVEFETFPPETSERISEGGGSLQGSRSFEYVLIPRVPGELIIPGIEIAYFDPASRQYGSARSEPLEISVTGDAVEGDVAGAVPTAVETIRDEIRFIHVGTPRFRRVGLPVYATGVFWLVLLVPLAAVGGAMVFRRHRDRLEGDVAYARVRRAGRMAKRRLARARGLAGGDPREFYAEVAGALQGLLADKLNIAEAGLVREEAGRMAVRRGASPETLERLFACLDDCDRQRFAPAGTDRESPERVLERAAGIMEDLARELSR